MDRSCFFLIYYLAVCSWEKVNMYSQGKDQCPCPAQWRHFNGFCYRITYNSESKTKAGAQEVCTQNNSLLVDIQSAKESEFVQMLLMARYHKSFAWLGLQRINGTFRWDRGELPLNFTNWHYKMYDKRLENCAVMFVHLFRQRRGWYPTACGDDGLVETIVCKKDADECCPGLDNCDVNAACVNTEGSFACACKRGFAGNASVGGCHDIRCNVTNIGNLFVSPAIAEATLSQTISFACGERFSLHGARSSTCTEEGWSRPFPVCRLKLSASTAGISPTTNYPFEILTESFAPPSFPVRGTSSGLSTLEIVLLTFLLIALVCFSSVELFRCRKEIKRIFPSKQTEEEAGEKPKEGGGAAAIKRPSVDGNLSRKTQANTSLPVVPMETNVAYGVVTRASTSYNVG